MKEMGMTFPATMTSKGRVTIPKAVRKQLGLTAGSKLDIAVEGRSFRARPKRRELAILAYRGSLKHLDDGRPWREIREEAHRAAAEYVMKRANRK